MRCQVGKANYRWLALCCAAWLSAGPLPALADGNSRPSGLASFRLQQERHAIEAGKVIERRATTVTRKRRLPQTDATASLPTMEPPEVELLPSAPPRNPFGPAPREAGNVTSRLDVAGKGLTLGVEMPF